MHGATIKKKKFGFINVSSLDHFLYQELPSKNLSLHVVVSSYSFTYIIKLARIIYINCECNRECRRSSTTINLCLNVNNNTHNVRINVTLRRVRVTIVAVEKQ